MDIRSRSGGVDSTKNEDVIASITDDADTTSAIRELVEEVRYVGWSGGYDDGYTSGYGSGYDSGYATGGDNASDR